MKKVRTLFENAQKKFFLVQAIVISMFANVAFCDDIFANINTKMTDVTFPGKKSKRSRQYQTIRQQRDQRLYRA